MVRKRPDHVEMKAKAVAAKGVSKRRSSARRVNPVSRIGHPVARDATPKVAAGGAESGSNASELYSQFRTSLLRHSSPMARMREEEMTAGSANGVRHRDTVEWAGGRFKYTLMT